MRRYTIGRHESNNIVIANPTVSRQHAELTELGGGAYRLGDLKSTSGTHAFVDGQWVEAAGVEVRPETKVGIGEHETTVRELLKLAGVVDPTEAMTQVPAMPRPLSPAPETAEAPPRAAAADKRAPTPKRPPPPAPPRAAPPKAAAPAAGKNRTTMWIAIGGISLLVLVGAAAVATVLLTGGKSASTASSASGTPATVNAPSGDQARFVAACQKRPGTSRGFCECFAKIVLADFTGGQRELLIRMYEEGASGDPDKIRQFVMAQREANPAEFFKKFGEAMPRVQSQCTT